MEATLFYTRVDHATYADDYDYRTGRKNASAPDTHRVLNHLKVCVLGMHVEYGMCVSRIGEVVVSATPDSFTHAVPCDGSCKVGARTEDFKEKYLREFYRCDDGDLNHRWEDFSHDVRKQFGCNAETHGRTVRSHIDDGGDSGSWERCFGSYHVVECCMEFGNGSDYTLARCPSESCDPWCQPRKIRLPRSVARWVKAHPAETLVKTHY